MRMRLASVALVLAGLLAVVASPAAATGRPPLPPLPDRRPEEIWTPPAEEERLPEAGRVGQRAPDFTLQALDGADFTLSGSLGTRPVVLLFGSYSCPVLRTQLPEFERLAERFGERATFVFVYVREAHPDSRLYLTRDGNEVLDVVRQTATRAERERLGRDLRETLDVSLTVLPDDDRNSVSAAYSGWPVRAVVVGRNGRIAYKNYAGPWGFWPADLQRWLERNLSGQTE